MKKQELRKEKVAELKIELRDILRDRLNINMQVANGNMRKTHLLKQVRSKIARVKTSLTEKEKVCND